MLEQHSRSLVTHQQSQECQRPSHKSVRRDGGDPVSHTVTSAPHSQETDSEKLTTSSGIADAPVLSRIDYTGRDANGMTVLEQLRGKVGHYGAGEPSPTLLMAACSRRFCEALRGLQVVCYAGSLGNGDKAGRAFQVHTLAARQGETGSRAQFSGAAGIDMLCHRLFCSDN